MYLTLSPRLTALSRPLCPRCQRLWSTGTSSVRAVRKSSSRPNKQSSVLDLLERRGYVNQIAGDRNALDQLLQTKIVGFYAGIDPTAPSLHIGHLLPLMVLFWLYFHGHTVVSLVGGATARVGDPSGRLTSRMQTAETVHQKNFESMFGQLRGIWDNAGMCGQRHGYGSAEFGRRELLNNATWLDGLTLLDFLKTLGSGMRIGTMLGRETVRNKMEKGDGMSFSEFTYPLLQAWDWWHMFRTMDIQVQIGGSDQYGNIIAGMDAVRYIRQDTHDNTDRGLPVNQHGELNQAYELMGLTVPLLTTSGGEKFGKSAGNAIWLNRNLTSPFDLYGFLLGSSDQDVERYLKLFTFVPLPEIEHVMKEHISDPGKRKAHHLLASEVLELVHGRNEAARARSEHQTFQRPTLLAFSRQNSQENGESASKVMGWERKILPASLVLNTPFSRILYHAGIVSTKSEGARLIAKRGAYVALQTPFGATDELTFAPIQEQKPEDVKKYVMDGLLIFRVGKWRVRIVEVVEDSEFDARNLRAPGWAEFKAASRDR